MDRGPVGQQLTEYIISLKPAHVDKMSEIYFDEGARKDTAFLKQCIGYDDTAERDRLEERIAQDQRNERCVRRAVWLMALLSALAIAGLCYAAVFLEDFPQNKSHCTAIISRR